MHASETMQPGSHLTSPCRYFASRVNRPTVETRLNQSGTLQMAPCGFVRLPVICARVGTEWEGGGELMGLGLIFGWIRSQGDRTALVCGV